MAGRVGRAAAAHQAVRVDAADREEGMKLTFTGRRLKSGAPYLNLTERARIIDTATGKEIFRTENYGQPAPKS